MDKTVHRVVLQLDKTNDSADWHKLVRNILNRNNPDIAVSGYEIRDLTISFEASFIDPTEAETFEKALKSIPLTGIKVELE
jgi:hypothetical protein